MQRFLALARHEYGLPFRLALAPAEAVIFLILLPRAFGRLGQALDRHFGLPPILIGDLGRMVAVLVGLPGALLAWWSIFVQYSRGRGTPLPVVATQRLVADGPFRYSRNPMTFGTLLLYWGVALWNGSLGAIFAVAAFGAALVAYIRGWEERELAARFGTDYEEYKRRVPFMIPRLR